MRKFASAILIIILLFNLFGYRLVSDYFEAKNDILLEARLDDNRYDESQLIELKIPVNMPYQTSWAEFERYDGEVELDGVLYKYVKRKVDNDTLILLCIPNHKKMDLQTAKNEFFKNTNDLAQNSSSKKPSGSKTISFKKLMSEYDDHSYAFSAGLITLNLQNRGFAYLVTSLLSSPHISPEQPPEHIGV